MYQYLFDKTVNVQSEQQEPASGSPKYEVLSISSPDSEVVWCTGPRLSLVFVSSDGPDGQRYWMMSGGRALDS